MEAGQPAAKGAEPQGAVGAVIGNAILPNSGAVKFPTPSW